MHRTATGLQAGRLCQEQENYEKSFKKHTHISTLTRNRRYKESRRRLTRGEEKGRCVRWGPAAGDTAEGDLIAGSERLAAGRGGEGEGTPGASSPRRVWGDAGNVLEAGHLRRAGASNH